MDGRDKGRSDTGIGRIVVWVFAGIVRFGAFKSGVVATQDVAFAAQQLAPEARGIDPQFSFLDVPDGQAGEVV